MNQHLRYATVPFDEMEAEPAHAGTSCQGAKSTLCVAAEEDSSLSRLFVDESASPKRNIDRVEETIDQPPLKKRGITFGSAASIATDFVEDEPEYVEPDEDEKLLFAATDKSYGKLELLSRLNFAQYCVKVRKELADVVSKKQQELQDSLRKVTDKTAEDLTLQDHRRIKYLFNFLIRCDGVAVDAVSREADKVHHFCLISPPRDEEVLRHLKRSVVKRVNGGVVSLTGHFVVLMQRGEGRNRHNQVFTTYRVVSPYLVGLIATALQVDSRRVFLREVLPKSTKVRHCLSGHDKYVLGHISLGGVSPLPPRQRVGIAGNTLVSSNVAPEDMDDVSVMTGQLGSTLSNATAFAGNDDNQMQVSSLVKVYINCIADSAEKDD